MHAILLIFDQPEKKTVESSQTDPLIKLFDGMLGVNSTKITELDCNCIRNNSIDRAKILVRYLRNELKLKDNQITFLRTSIFDNAEETRLALEYIFESNDKDDILLYYSGHGLIGDKPGWSMGEKKYLLYESLRGIFGRFSGRLAVINDCCYSLGLNSALQVLGSRYALFGPARFHCISSNTILDSVLGYWKNRMIAFPKVAAVGMLDGYLMDVPAYVAHPSYYNCGCGSYFKLLKTFKAGNAPSLRRGGKIDELFFPA